MLKIYKSIDINFYSSPSTRIAKIQIYVVEILFVIAVGDTAVYIHFYWADEKKLNLWRGKNQCFSQATNNVKLYRTKVGNTEPYDKSHV